MTKILITDDSTFMRKNLKSILTDAGYEVIGEAKNGLEAVELFKSLQPDLVTLDITMPKLDGINALKQIRAIDNTAKVIMCTAIGQKSYIQEAINSGASEYIVKPFQANSVLLVVNKVLSKGK